MNTVEVKEALMKIINEEGLYTDDFFSFLKDYNLDLDTEVLCLIDFIYGYCLINSFKPFNNVFFEEYLLSFNNLSYLNNNEKYLKAFSIKNIFDLKSLEVEIIKEKETGFTSTNLKGAAKIAYILNEKSELYKEQKNSIINELNSYICKVFNLLDDYSLDLLKNILLKKKDYNYLINLNPNDMKIFYFEEVKDNNKKFLNKYILYYLTKNNKEKKYEIVTRHKINCINDLGNHTDAIMIVPITTDGKMVLLKEFRMGVNKYIYNFPAGIIENNENEIEAAKRELFEETGLTCVNIKKVLKPAFSSAGMTDEKVTVVFMEVEGTLSNENIEDNESIYPIIFDKESLSKELEISEFGGKSQLICYNFTIN